MEVEPNNNNEENNNNNNELGRGRGRQRIAMKKIENSEDLLISFSKRRSGIYKKASELATLCAADIGFLAFSPAGKPYTYGSPSVHSVFDRFTGNAPPPSAAASAAPLLEAHRRRRVAELSERHEGLFDDLDTQRALRRDLKGLKLGGDEDEEEEEEEEDDVEDLVPAWWDAPLDGMEPEQLRERKEALVALHSRIAGHLRKRQGEASGSGSAPFPPSPPPPPPSAGAAF